MKVGSDFFSRHHWNTDARNKRKRNQASPEWKSQREFLAWARRQLTRQDLKCSISDRPLKATAISIERLDESLGYSPSNCVFIRPEFQARGGVYQWTRERYQSLLQTSVDMYDQGQVEEALSHEACSIAQGGKRPTVWSKHVDESEWTEHESIQQAAAQRGVPPGLVTDRARQQYKTTYDGVHYRYEMARKVLHPNCLHRFFQMIHDSTVESTKKRNEKGRNHAHDMTIRDWIERWQAQRGRCAYTGVCMSIATNTAWKCSPERKDNAMGYVKGNVVLIVTECNNRTQWSLDDED